VAVDAPAILQEADRLAALDLWPGFDARAIPVALFDGERTWLYGHPAPPAEYQPGGRAGMLVRSGRDTLVWANSSVMMNGVRAATVMPGAGGAGLAERAAVVIHERFHVYQIARHPHWEANEVDLFTYPVADGDLLSLRRQESAALRRALDAGDRGQVACWSRAALDARRRRFSRLPPAASNYERRSEWREGLANYVQARSLGFPGGELPAAEFRPDEVRQRTYATGVVLGRLLDRLDPSWRELMERRDSVTLDSALGLAVAAAPGAVCSFPAGELAALERTAHADAGALRAGLAAAREAFLARPGLTVVITAGAEPLWPQGFDPLNVRVVSPSEVLHTRFVRLGNRSGSIEVLGDSALTVAAGEHPMFNGVRSITLTGLPAGLAVTAAGDSVAVHHARLRASFRGAALERGAGRLTITLR
jgi:hypothetical protein